MRSGAVMVRLALLALMVIALDLAWWIMPEPGAAGSWPRTAEVGRCSITLHEPRRDPVANEAGAHTIRLVFACVHREGGRDSRSGTGRRTLLGTAVVIGEPLVEAGPYALSGARCRSPGRARSGTR